MVLVNRMGHLRYLVEDELERFILPASLPSQNANTSPMQRAEKAGPTFGFFIGEWNGGYRAQARTADSSAMDYTPSVTGLRQTLDDNYQQQQREKDLCFAAQCAIVYPSLSLPSRNFGSFSNRYLSVLVFPCIAAQCAGLHAIDNVSGGLVVAHRSNFSCAK